jgi:hypothetical protein
VYVLNLSFGRCKIRRPFSVTPHRRAIAAAFRPHLFSEILMARHGFRGILLSQNRLY